MHGAGTAGNKHIGLRFRDKRIYLSGVNLGSVCVTGNSDHLCIKLCSHIGGKFCGILVADNHRSFESAVSNVLLHGRFAVVVNHAFVGEKAVLFPAGAGSKESGYIIKHNIVILSEEFRF